MGLISSNWAFGGANKLTEIKKKLLRSRKRDSWHIKMRGKKSQKEMIKIKLSRGRNDGKDTLRIQNTSPEKRVKEKGFDRQG